MKFETVQIHFLRDSFGLLSCRNSVTTAMWRNDFPLSMKPVTRAEFSGFTFSFFLSLEYPVDTLVNALFSTAFWSSSW